MLNELTNQANDLYFARNGNTTDAATVAEIARDLRFFIAKVQGSDLTASIKAALIKTASK